MVNKIAALLCAGFISVTTLYAQSDAPKTYTGPKENLHIYLLIGQSNMSGRAPFTKEESGVIDRAWLFNYKEKWEPAKNPFNRYSTVRKVLWMQKMNPGYTFTKTMLEKDKSISIGLVVNAKGGTIIEQWKKGTHFYNEAVKRTKEAQKTGILKGILWHQGEGNHNRDPDGYLEKLKTLVADLRKDLGISDLPFIAGQVYKVPKISDQIAMLPQSVPHTAFASSEGLTAMDRWHFDARSMRLLGQRYAEELLKLQAKMKLQNKPAAGDSK